MSVNSINNPSMSPLTTEAPPILNLPKDIFLLFCRYSDTAKNILSLARTSRQLYSLVITNDLLWSLFLQTHFPDSCAPDSCVNLKSEAKSFSFYKYLTRVDHYIKAGKYRSQTLYGTDRNSIDALAVCEGNIISGSSSFKKGIKVRDLESGQELRAFDVSAKCIVFHSGKIIASGFNTIVILDFKTGKKLKTLNGHQDFINGIIVYENKLISYSGDKKIKIWNLESGEELFTLQGQRSVTSIVVYNGKIISGSDDGMIKVWDLESGQELQTLKGHRWRISSLSAYGGKLLSGSWDGTIRIWDLKSGKELQTLFKFNDAVSNIVTYDRKIICSSDNEIRIFDLESGKELRTLSLESKVGAIAFCNGKLLSSGDTDTRIQITNFNPPSPYSKEALEENLLILDKMTLAYDQPEVFKELSKNLHPDFKQRLRQHSLKLWTSAVEILPSSILSSFSKDVFTDYPCSGAIARVQTEVCVEALLDAIHDEEQDKVSQLLEQLIKIDPQNRKIHDLLGRICDEPSDWAKHAFHNREGCSASLLDKEEAVIKFKQVLKERWGEDFPLLLVDLGIFTKDLCSQKLKCSPDHLSKIGICSSDDLHALGLFQDSFHFDHLKAVEAATNPNQFQDIKELQDSTFAKKELVFSLLEDLFNASEKMRRSGENKALFHGTVNIWISFQKKLEDIGAALTSRCETRSKILKTFDPASYANIVDQMNALVDEFGKLVCEHQIAKLSAYINQRGILKAWSEVYKPLGINSLFSLLKQKDILLNDPFQMGI